MGTTVVDLIRYRRARERDARVSNAKIAIPAFVATANLRLVEEALTDPEWVIVMAALKSVRNLLATALAEIDIFTSPPDPWDR